MATHHGKEGVVKIGANSVAEIVDFNVDENAAVVDDSAKGDSWDSHLTGRARRQRTGIRRTPPGSRR